MAPGPFPVFAAPVSVKHSDGALLKRKSNCACGGGCPRCAEEEHAGNIQTKLQVSNPGDQYEQEADRVAEQVMRMPESRHAQVAELNEKNSSHLSRHSSPGASHSYNVPPVVSDVLSSPGQPLDASTRAFMEPRFGHDFGQVRIHTGHKAAESAHAVKALAYTVGRNIVFGEQQFAPDTATGKILLAHELAHVVQQQAPSQPASIQRFPSCTSAQDTLIAADHTRALQMLSVAIRKISSYDGTSPVEVHTALATHFNGSTSDAFATWININLRLLRAAMDDDYECFTGGIMESMWACPRPTTLATSFWCVPGFDIRVCPPYFAETPIERSTTLIHEWVHKFGCNFDLDYEHDSGYGSNSIITQLLNADPFANLVRDVQ
jgi:hypothetical protein